MLLFSTVLAMLALVAPPKEIQGEQLRILQDPNKEFSAEFLASNPEIFIMPGSKDMFLPVGRQIWVKFEPTSAHGNYLHIPNLYLEHIDVYLINPENQSAEPIGTMGYEENFQGLGQGLNYAIGLPDIEEGSSLLIRITGEETPFSPHWLPIRVGSIEELIKDGRVDHLISQTTTAIIFGLFLFNLVLLIVVKESLYLYYVAYVFTVLQLNLFITGFYFEFVWPNNPELNVIEVPLCLSYMAFLAFINQLLKSHMDSPVYRFSFRALLILSMLMLISVVIPGAPTILLVNILGLVIPIFTVASILNVKDSRLKNFLLFGYVPLMLAILVYTLLDFGFFFSTFVRLHIVQFGIVWELLVFSIFLGSRYNRLESEKEAYKNQNLQLLEDYTSRLEKEIKLRTIQLEEKTQLLESQGEEIIAQRDLLARANHELEYSKSTLEKYNKNLEDKVRQRTSRLLKTNDLLDKQLKSMEQFSYIAAHNLRAPVARIKGLTNLVELESRNSNNIEWVSKLNIAVDDLDEIVTDLGTIMELQAHELERTPTNVLGTIDLVRQKLGVYEDDSIDWRLDLSVQEIQVIPSYFNTIVYQCISNALKFREIQQKLVISIKAREENNRVYFSLSDNGLGFDSDKFKDKIFEPFQRFNTKKEGKGLGLFLVKSHVDSMGGTIRLKSMPGVGTKVDIEIPTM